jgi:hypothetical protein
LDNKPRILVVDIETAPAELWGWGMFKQNFGVEQVKKAPYILCIGAKWVGQKDIFMFSQWEHGTQGMLGSILELIEEADAVVSKNGIKFDIPWIRTELLLHKMRPLPALTHIDLEKAARYYFRFLSNKLDWIGQYLGEGAKVEHEGFKLWRKVMEGDPYARRRMLRYCAGDIKLTERCYIRMRPHIENHPAIRAIGSTACQKCQSKKTQRRGWRYTACFRVQRHQCTNCGGWFSGKREKVA